MTVLAKGYAYYETMRALSEEHGYRYRVTIVEKQVPRCLGYYQFKVHLGITKILKS